MRGRNLQNRNGIGRLLVVVFVMGGAGSAQAASGDSSVNKGVKSVAQPVAAGACKRAVVEGEARAGESFARPIGRGPGGPPGGAAGGCRRAVRACPASGAPPRPCC